MRDQIIILAQYPFYIWILVAAVAGIMLTGVYFFYYHVIKYPHGTPKNNKR